MTLRVLAVTTEWPTPDLPDAVPFLVRRVEALREAGVEVEVHAFRGKRRLRNYVKASREIQKRIRANSYDVVHAHFGQSGLTLLRSPIPVVVTFRGSDLQGIVDGKGRYSLRGRFLVTASRLVARRADEVIVVSERLGQKLPKGVRYRVVPTGVDLELFRPGDRAAARRRLRLPSGQKLILFSGRPEMPVKRFWLAQRAVSLVPREFRADLIAVSGQPPTVVADYMRASDVLLLTSRHEGAPPMVREALACSLPVVSVDVGDVRGLIGGLPGCVVCEDDHPDTLANALRAALTHSGEFKGRERVLDLDERRLAELDVQAYRSAIHRRTKVRTL